VRKLRENVEFIRGHCGSVATRRERTRRRAAASTVGPSSIKSLKRHPSNPGGIPNLNLVRHCCGTVKEVNNTIIKDAPSGGMLVCADTDPNREQRRCLLTGTFRSNGVVPDDRSRNSGSETPRLSDGQKHLPDCYHQTRPEPPASLERIGHTPGQRQRSPAGKARQALQAALCEERADFYARHAWHA
jgi:hypothetical protein